MVERKETFEASSHFLYSRKVRKLTGPGSVPEHWVLAAASVRAHFTPSCKTDATTNPTRLLPTANAYVLSYNFYQINLCGRPVLQFIRYYVR
jgi:hypothetical protein